MHPVSESEEFKWPVSSLGWNRELNLLFKEVKWIFFLLKIWTITNSWPCDVLGQDEACSQVPRGAHADEAGYFSSPSGLNGWMHKESCSVAARRLAKNLFFFWTVLLSTSLVNRCQIYLLALKYMPSSPAGLIRQMGHISETDGCQQASSLVWTSLMDVRAGIVL